MGDRYYRGQRSVNDARPGTPAASPARVLTMIDDYRRKVREIALLQSRCETGADLETGRPEPAGDQEPQAA